MLMSNFFFTKQKNKRFKSVNEDEINMGISTCLKKLAEEQSTCTMAAMLANKNWDTRTTHEIGEYHKIMSEYNNLLNLLLTHAQVSGCAYKDQRIEYIQKTLSENQLIVNELDRAKWVAHQFIAYSAVLDLTYAPVILHNILKSENRKTEIDKIKTEIGRALKTNIEAQRQDKWLKANSDDPYTQSKIAFGFLDSIEADPLLSNLNEENCEILYPAHYKGFLLLLDRKTMITERLRIPISKGGTRPLSLPQIMYSCVYTEDDHRRIDSYIEKLGYKDSGTPEFSYRV